MLAAGDWEKPAVIARCRDVIVTTAHCDND